MMRRRKRSVSVVYLDALLTRDRPPGTLLATRKHGFAMMAGLPQPSEEGCSRGVLNGSASGGAVLVYGRGTLARSRGLARTPAESASFADLAPRASALSVRGRSRGMKSGHHVCRDEGFEILSNSRVLWLTREAVNRDVPSGGLMRTHLRSGESLPHPLSRRFCKRGIRRVGIRAAPTLSAGGTNERTLATR